MFKRFYDWLRYLRAQGMYIAYTPYYEAIPVVPGSFNERHMEKVITISPKSLLEGGFKDISEWLISHGEYICGFDESLYPEDPEKFMLELLIPGLSFRDVKRRGDVPQILQDCIHWGVSGAMAISCVKYVQEVILNDISDPDFNRVLSAPCFLSSITDIWTPDLTAEQQVREVYYRDRLARYE